MSSPGPLPSDELVTKVMIAGSELRYEIYEFLTSIRIVREFRLPTQATLRFDVPHGLPEGLSIDDFAFKVGGEFQVDAGTTSLLKGLISAMEFEQSGSGNTVVVTALDKAHKLGQITQEKAHLKLPIADLVRSIASEAGLQAAVDPSYSAYTNDYLLQVETDFDLLNTLADRCGADWWVEGTELHFAPTSAGAPVGILKLGHNLQSWRVRVTEPPLSSVSVRARNPLERTIVRGQATFAEATPKAVADYLTAARPTPPTGSVVITQLPMEDNSQADAFAKALIDSATSAAVTGEGACDGWPQLKPGDRVKLEGCGTASGTYPVNSVTHQLRGGLDWTTRFTTGPRTPRSFVDLFGPQRNSPSFRHDGLVVGLVTNNRDPEGKGRVKVAYPTLVQSSNMATESDWARIISLGGGNARGQVSLPEIDDEVLVGFENGNLRHAVVIGGLFGNEAIMPPVLPDATGQVPSRAITSRLGHVLEFGDGLEPTSQHISMAVTAGPTMRLGVDESTLTLMPTSKLTIMVGDSSIVIDAESITLTGLSVSVQAGDQASITGAAKVVLESAGELDMSAAVKAALSAGVIEVAADEMLKMSGAITQVN